MAVTAEDRATAVKLLEQATRLEPGNAVYWYALKDAATDIRDRVPGEQAQMALKQAYALNPRNLFLLTEMLLMQAATEDRGIEQTLAAAKDVLRSLIPGVKQRRNNLDLGEMIDSALQAVQENNWRMASAQVRMLNNVVRPEEVAKSDIDRVNVHPLEFVAYDFSPEFYDQYGRAAPAWSESSSLTLEVLGADAVWGAAATGPADVLSARVMDFDVNGSPDLLLLQPGRLSIWGRAASDQPYTRLAALDVPAGATGVLVADLDRDRRRTISAPAAESAEDPARLHFDKVVTGSEVCHDADPDIVLYGADGAWVIRNNLSAAQDAPPLELTSNDALAALRRVTAGVLVDVDHDGELDIVFASAEGISIWRAGAALAYSNTSEYSALPTQGVPVSAMVAVDWDRDADIDIVTVGTASQAVGLMENMRHGEFRWVELPSRFDALQQPVDVAVLEADGNVSWDLLAAGPRGLQLYLSSTPRPGVVNYQQTVDITANGMTGVSCGDVDNDGFRDAVTWNASGVQVWRGGPSGAWQQAEVLRGELPGEVRQVLLCDLDRDGDQDAVVIGAQRIALVRNTGVPDNHWLTIYPMGDSDNKGRCNHHAIGSMVEVRAGAWYQAQVIDAAAAHFGLGAQQVAQQVRVVWTNGVPQDLVDQRGNVAICEPMILKGSCPYLYTLADGQFSFFTDCLWAAPIGMQTPAGTIAPTRSWEYLLIPGERLTAEDGTYGVMLTEELWEAGYFDFVQLIAVDHPADVEVYCNEKVGPGDLATHQIFTVGKRRYPDRMVDQEGRDVCAQLQQRDGDFARLFTQRVRQGYVTPHFLELDLGQLDQPQRIMLFLTGWIMPTDTSLNVAFAQDPETDGPSMPSVWVPDAQGAWRETIAYMGFPGGKTKTIAVDLSRAFLTSDYRVRIQTTAEIYWDEVFFTVDEPPAEVRQQPLPLVSAQLAYRGISAYLPRSDESPQMYDARVVRTGAMWPPMRGRFTRYGDVMPLLTEGDDLMAVIGAGDALTLRFANDDAQLPNGWKRDFVLHSIGYDKDADLNTLYGQTSDPLPFRAMTSYPFAPDELPPDSAAYRQYLKKYQTRQQVPQQFWRKLVLP